MSGPTRATPEGRAYLDLQNKARRDGRSTDELLQLYALEGFLARLAGSDHAAKLVLKGGVLLAAFGTRRPTRDIDFQARALPNDAAPVLQLVREIAGLDVGDGLVFDPASARAQIIRDEEEYSGVRVSLAGSLAQARLRFHVDVNVGDPVWPAPRTVQVPRLLGGPSIGLAGYPLPMVYAEKVVTAAQRGAVNTRWRDFADVWVLSGTHPVDGADLQGALAEVAGYRSVALEPLAEVLEGYAELAQRRWAAWRRKQRLDHLPADFADVLAAVFAFADPAIAGRVAAQRWDPHTRTWS